MATRSPVRHATKALAFGLKKRYWTCDAVRLGAAEFASRERPGETVIVHPSTKSKGKWQTSYFENGVPTHDLQSSSCHEALSHVPPTKWRLRSVLSKR